MNLPPPLPQALPPPSSPRFARLGWILALVLIVVSIASVLWEGSVMKPARTPVKAAFVKPSALTDILARYVIGAREMMKLTRQWSPEAGSALAKSLADSSARKPVETFRAKIVEAVLLERPVSETALAKLEKEAPQLAEDIALIRTLKDPGQSINADQWERFTRRHGWIARLAHAQATGWPQPERGQLLQEASATTIAFVSAAMVGFAAFALGTVLFVLFIVRWRRGVIIPALQRPDPLWGPCLVEGFAIYLFGYALILPLLRRWIPTTPLWVAFTLGLVFVIIGALWPRWRGMDSSAWRQAIGFHRGQGFFREVAYGLMGWCAGLPLLAVCSIVTMLLVKWTGIVPTHPIVDEITHPGFARWMMVLLATVWAPLVEETMFRGLLFPGLSSKFRWVAGAITGAFIFAIIHPQGWVGAFPLMALALTMTTLRTFRGSLIAPMTTHALNNGSLCALLILAS